MKIKNKTNSNKELTDILTGKRILVRGKGTVELERATFNPNAFEVVKEKHIEQKEQKITEKEVKE